MCHARVDSTKDRVQRTAVAADEAAMRSRGEAADGGPRGQVRALARVRGGGV
jgi:hypothetical protein